MALALLGLCWRPPALFPEASGFCVRRLLGRGRLVPWDDVDRVVVQGPWELDSLAVLTSGAVVHLTHLPRDDARRLAQALAQVRVT